MTGSECRDYDDAALHTIAAPLTIRTSMASLSLLSIGKSEQKLSILCKTEAYGCLPQDDHRSRTTQRAPERRRLGPRGARTDRRGRRGLGGGGAAGAPSRRDQGQLLLAFPLA